MGLDGGTIASRTDLLRRASWRLANNDGGAQRSTRGGQLTVANALNSAGVERYEERTEALDAFATCALSGAALPAAPEPGAVVACSLGRLYLRTAVVEYLTSHGQFAEGMCDPAALSAACGHIERLRDVFGLTLTPNPRRAAPVMSRSEFLAQGQLGDGAEETAGPWVCPIDRDCSSNGTHRFVALRPCGHMMREQVVLEVARRVGGGGASSSGSASSSGGANSSGGASSSGGGARTGTGRASDGISTIEGGVWHCPVCSHAVEVSVKLVAGREVTERVRASLAVERAARAERKEQKKRKRAAEGEPSRPDR